MSATVHTAAAMPERPGRRRSRDRHLRGARAGLVARPAPAGRRARGDRARLAPARGAGGGAPSCQRRARGLGPARLAGRASPHHPGRRCGGRAACPGHDRRHRSLPDPTAAGELSRARSPGPPAGQPAGAHRAHQQAGSGPRPRAAHRGGAWAAAKYPRPLHAFYARARARRGPQLAASRGGRQAAACFGNQGVWTGCGRVVAAAPPTGRPAKVTKVAKTRSTVTLARATTLIQPHAGLGVLGAAGRSAGSGDRGSRARRRETARAIRDTTSPPSDPAVEQAKHSPAPTVPPGPPSLPASPLRWPRQVRKGVGRRDGPRWPDRRSCH